MYDEISILMAADPRVIQQIQRIQRMIPDANISQIVRAAVLYFGEGVPEHEIRVYVDEQINLEIDDYRQ